MICCHALGAATFPSLKEPLCNVRFGSLADILRCGSQSALPPKADMQLGMSALCQQRTFAYSITSSALASSVGGTVRPSAFAVFRLMTIWYFVGACTGMSAGFSPLRMRST